MTTIAAAKARHRRKNVASPWRSLPPPLPPTAPRRSAAVRTIATMTSGALLFAMLLLGAALFAVFDAALPAAVEVRSPLRGRRARRAHGRGDRRGAGRREARAVGHVDVSKPAPAYDVVVAGCGPAGLSAALFASRMGLSVLVLGSPSTGSLAGTLALENFPSFVDRDGLGGRGWVDAAMEQATSFGTLFAPPTYLATGLARGMADDPDAYEVRLGAELAVRGRTVIVASGSVPRRLDLPRESSLWGRSIHNCALCDGDLYVRDGAKKTVAVVGGGDAAVEAIFLLHQLGVDTIHWIHRREEYRANAPEVERVRRLPNVNVWAPFVVAEWMAKERDESGTDHTPLALEGIRIVGAIDGAADPESVSSLTIPCDGVFLMIGSTPNSQWLQFSGVDIDPVTKLIRLPTTDGGALSNGKDSNPTPQFSTSTSIKDGVFAAGEVVDGVYRQALTAAAEGAQAAIDAQRYLRHLKIESSKPTSDSLAAEAGQSGEERTREIDKQAGSKEKHTVGPMDCDLTKPECIESVVSTHAVVVFSKSYCPHCRRALEALRSLTEPLVVEINEIKNGMGVQKTLGGMTGRWTVPNVFIGGESIGGGDETVALFQSGKLGGLILKATMG